MKTGKQVMSNSHPIINLALAMLIMLATGVQARTWTRIDGSKTFEAEMKAYDPATGDVTVTLPDRSVMTFN